jgi:transmembrane sensor
MSPTLTRDQETTRRLAEAAAWRVRLTEEEAETSEAFEAWMADPANVAAWDQVQSPWRQVGEKATSPEVMALRAGALARAQRHGRRRWMRGAGPRIAASVAAVMLVAGGFGGWRWYETRPQDYRTMLGERRVIPLADGSKVSLDSGSEVRIRYTKDARKLELLAGQARFDVAHDVQRPFSVTARDQTVVATGTAFNVDLLGRKVLVTLIEGHVVVLHAPAVKHDAAPRSASGQAPPEQAVELNAGEQLIAAAATPPQVTQANLERATAWETGQLAFKDEPLASVAERVSRYAAEPVVAAPDAANLRVSGVFKAGDIASFVDIVTSYLPVRAVRQPDGEIVLQSNG